MIKKLTVAPMLLVLLVTTGILAILAYTMFTSKATNHGTETAAVSATEAQSSTPTPTTASQKQEGDEKQSLKSNTNPWDQDPRFLWSTSIIAFVIVVWIWNRYNLSTSYWDKYRVNNSAIPALVCIGLVHLVIYKLAPQFWWNNIFNGWSFGLQLALLLVMSIKPENPKKPTKHKLSTVAAVLLGITFLLHITVGDVSVEEKFKHLSTAQATTRGGNAVALAPLTRSSFEMESKPCLEHDGLKGVDSQRIREALKGYPGLLSISCRETKLNHRDPENPGSILLGKIDPRDIGFLQINTYYHPSTTVETAVGCKDLKEFSCSEKYGKKLYDDYGLEPWFPHGPNESGRQYAPLTVTDTAGIDFGPRINIPEITRETRFDVTIPVIVEVEYKSGEKKEFTLTPNKFTDMGISVNWLRFKRTPNATENGKVTITYTFYKVP